MDTKEEKGNKDPKVYEAYVYLKNTKVIPVKGEYCQGDATLVFNDGVFTSTFKNESIAVVIRDLLAGEKEGLNINTEIRGFEIYTETGTSIGFNGYEISEELFLSEYDDLIQIRDVIAYKQAGPRQEQKDPTAKKDNKNG